MIDSNNKKNHVYTLSNLYGGLGVAAIGLLLTFIWIAPSVIAFFVVFLLTDWPLWINVLISGAFILQGLAILGAIGYAVGSIVMRGINNGEHS